MPRPFDFFGDDDCVPQFWSDNPRRSGRTGLSVAARAVPGAAQLLHHQHLRWNRSYGYYQRRQLQQRRRFRWRWVRAHRTPSSIFRSPSRSILRTICTSPIAATTASARSPAARSAPSPATGKSAITETEARPPAPLSTSPTASGWMPPATSTSPIFTTRWSARSTPRVSSTPLPAKTAATATSRDGVPATSAGRSTSRWDWPSIRPAIFISATARIIACARSRRAASSTAWRGAFSVPTQEWASMEAMAGRPCRAT